MATKKPKTAPKKEKVSELVTLMGHIQENKFEEAEESIGKIMATKVEAKIDMIN
jgi:hypothetical protein